MATAVEGPVDGGDGFSERGLLRWGSRGRNHIEQLRRQAKGPLMQICSPFLRGL